MESKGSGEEVVKAECRRKEAGIEQGELWGRQEEPGGAKGEAGMSEASTFL